MKKLKREYQELEDIDVGRGGKEQVNLKRRPSSAPFGRKGGGAGDDGTNDVGATGGGPLGASSKIGVDDVPLPVTRIQITRSFRKMSIGSNKSNGSNRSNRTISTTDLGTTISADRAGGDRFPGGKATGSDSGSFFLGADGDERIELAADEGPIPLRMDLQSRLTRLFAELKMEPRSQLAMVVK